MADGVEIAHAYLYILTNDEHEDPFGLLEDVYVEEAFRGEGEGSKLVREVIAYASERCYKLVATSRESREKVHALYGRLGFANYGREFRIDFS